MEIVEQFFIMNKHTHSRYIKQS